MALLLGALRDALVNAGATQEKANKAAEELAGDDSRLAGIDTRLSVPQWIAGTNLAATAGTLFKLMHG